MADYLYMESSYIWQVSAYRLSGWRPLQPDNMKSLRHFKKEKKSCRTSDYAKQPGQKKYKEYW